MEDIYQSLLTLQELDGEIEEAEERVSAFDPELAVIDAPARALAEELEAAKAQLEEYRTEIRRLERTTAERQELLSRAEARLQKVRTRREEEAALTEIDLIRSAIEADETDTLGLMDRALRTELKIDELEAKLEAARAEIAPRRKELEEKKAEADHELAVLKDRRVNHAIRLDPESVQLYDRIRAGKTKIAIVGLTPDGACGCCYGFIPIQRRTEIEQGSELIRCEECGVILHPCN